MTVSSTTDRSGPYNGNGATVEFAYEFRILEDTHITVVQKSAAGVETVLTSTDYTVAGVGDSGGGSITLDIAPPTGETITIIRNAPFTQMVDLENQGAYFAETVERALDLTAMRDQQLSERLDRAVQIPISANPASLDGLVEDIIRLGDSADAIDAVAGIAPNVTTVAGISANVTTVAGVAAAVTAVAGIAAAVTTVASVAAAVTAVAGIAAAVVIVAGIAAAVSAVAANETNINAVAGNAANINAVTGIEAEIIAVPALVTAAEDAAAAAAASAASTGLPPILPGDEGKTLYVKADRSGYELDEAGGGDVIATGSITARSIADRFSELPNARDFGASALNLDNSSEIEAAATWCAANGHALLRVNDDLVATSVNQTTVADLTFVGNGSITGVYRKAVIPLNAPDDTMAGTDLVAGRHLTRTARAAAPVAVLLGDSISLYAANSWARQDMLISCLQGAVDQAFGQNIALHNRAIGGKGFAHPLTAITGADEDWYTNDAIVWLDYVRDLLPDVVFVSFGMNDAGSISYTAINNLVAAINAFPKRPDIVFCTNLTPSMSSAPDDTKAVQEARDKAAGLIRTYAKLNGYGLLDFHRQACLVRDGFDPCSGTIKIGDTVAAVAAGVDDEECVGTKEVYQFKAKITFNASGWTNDDLNSYIRVPTGPGSGDYLQIIKFSNCWRFVAVAGDFATSTNTYHTGTTGIAFPTGTTERICVEVTADRIEVYDDSLNLGQSTQPLLSIRRMANGGLFAPIIKGFNTALVTSTQFFYSEPRKNLPSLTDKQLWGDGSPGIDDYGGSGFNHPSHFVASHIYRPVIRAAQFSMASGLPLHSGLTADRSGTDVNTAQAVFGSSQDALTVEGKTAYRFRAQYVITRAAGATSHTTGVLLGGTATFTSIDALAKVSNPTGNVLGAVSEIQITAATETVLTTANTATTENIRIALEGIMRINAGGTIIPQFKFSAAPGGAPTIKRNSFFECWPIGGDAVAAIGPWA